MTVKQLRAIMARLPDDAPVLVPGSDHSYSLIGYAEFEAARSGRYYCEYYSEEDLEPGECKVPALILR